jgi:hypothetical protein
MQPDHIIITDDGVGMGLSQINNRFLSVGYDKRTEEGETSKNGRPFMGRKGIGKLALFSIADEIEIHTRIANEKHGFRMRTADIRKAIEDGKSYYPVPINFEGSPKGTRILLRSLKKKRTGSSITALRKRIARRFSVIGYEGPSGDQFLVTINGQAVGADDREDMRAIEFLWEFGKHRVNAAHCPNLRESFLLPDQVSTDHDDWKVRGYEWHRGICARAA